MLLAYLRRRLEDENPRERRAREGPHGSRCGSPQPVRANQLREMAGSLPGPARLAARTTRVIERAGYRIENILFQSQTDYWIPANLYLPTTRSGPFPAIVIQRGHFNAERMSPDYQQLYFDLVQNGFAVLSYDSIGQGERRQYYAGDEAFEELLSPTLEHCAIGGLLSLIGESTAGWFVADGMRAVDYFDCAQGDRRQAHRLRGSHGHGMEHALPLRAGRTHSVRVHSRSRHGAPLAGRPRHLEHNRRRRTVAVSSGELRNRSARRDGVARATASADAPGRSRN